MTVQTNAVVTGESNVSYSYDSNGNVVGLVNGNSEIYIKNTDIDSKRIKVGVNHMPGWAYGWDVPGANGGPWPSDPWSHVPADRVPLKGTYQGYNQTVVDQQLREMRDYGIDFIMADWFYCPAHGRSQTDLTIGNGSKSWTVWPGYDTGFQVGMKVTATGTLDYGNGNIGTMTGLVTAYSSTTGVVTINITANTGSGSAGLTYGANSGWELLCTADSAVGASTPVGTLDYFIKLWKSSTVPSKPKLCLTWANATNASLVTDAGWSAHFQNAITGYFSDPNYFKINGKPVIAMIDFGRSMPALSVDSLAQQNTLITAVRAATVAAGYPDLYFVAGISSLSEYWRSSLSYSAMDAVYALNVGYRHVSGADTLTTQAKATFDDIDWNTFGVDSGGYVSWTQSAVTSTGVTTSRVKLWTPISAGFDKTPWESTELLGTPTKEQFAAHLTKARKFIEDNYSYTNGFCVIQSWNEHLEGSVVEPNSSGGYTKLEQIRDILSC